MWWIELIIKFTVRYFFEPWAENGGVRARIDGDETIIYTWNASWHYENLVDFNNEFTRNNPRFCLKRSQLSLNHNIIYLLSHFYNPHIFTRRVYFLTHFRQKPRAQI